MFTSFEKEKTFSYETNGKLAEDVEEARNINEFMENMFIGDQEQ